MPDLLSYDYHKVILSKKGQRIVDLATGELTWGQVVSLCKQVSFLPREERSAVFVVLKQLLSPERYAEIHGYYVRYVLGHRWGA